MTRPTKAAIRRLRSGTVPIDSMEFLSAGYEGLRDLVLERVVRLHGNQPVPPLFVRGEWGTGKTHFAQFVRALGRRLEVATAVVDLDARNRPLNYPQRFYPMLLGNLRFGAGPLGLRPILTSYLTTEEGRRHLSLFATRHRGEIAVAVSCLCRHFEDEEGSLLASTGENRAWFTALGGDIAWGTPYYKRSAALRRLSEVATLLRWLGAGGLIVLLDEVETIDQLWNIHSRIGAYETLGKLFEMESVWCVLSVTDRFEAIVRRDLDGGLPSRPDLPLAAQAFLRMFQRYERITPPTLDSRLSWELARRLLQVYYGAYGSPSITETSISALVGAWLRDPRRNARTLIRSVIDDLDRRRVLPRQVAPSLRV